MKQFEFETQLSENATIQVPVECATQIPSGEAVRVILLLPDDDEDRTWGKLAAGQFVQGYADSDAIYDEL
jgi:hypothetical protein